MVAQHMRGSWEQEHSDSAPLSIYKPPHFTHAKVIKIGNYLGCYLSRKRLPKKDA